MSGRRLYTVGVAHGPPPIWLCLVHIAIPMQAATGRRRLPILTCTNKPSWSRTVVSQSLNSTPRYDARSLGSPHSFRCVNQLQKDACTHVHRFQVS